MRSEISPARLGLTFAGCFLGAGYVSGREMWQFFGAYGVRGFGGLFFALLLLAVLGAVTLLLALETGRTELGFLVVPWELPALRAAVEIFSLIFLLGIDCIMTAGVAALFAQAFGLPAPVCGFVFSLLIAVLTLTGLEGMISAFSMIVPLLTALTVAFAIASCVFLPAEGALIGGSEVLQSTASQNPFSWLFSALVFAAYNMFGSVAIIAPLGDRLKERRTLVRGIALGTLVLLVTAAAILVALLWSPSASEAELPMLSIAMRLSAGPGRIFALLLFAAMLGTAFSSFLTAFRQLSAMFVFVHRREKGFAFLFSLLIWLGSLFGFGRLIDVIYPLFGILGAGFLACLLVHYIKIQRKKREDRGGRS